MSKSLFKGDFLETLKKRLSCAEAVRRTNETSETSNGVNIAVAVNRQTGKIIIRFDDREFAVSKKKALALIAMIQKKADELI